MACSEPKGELALAVVAVRCLLLEPRGNIQVFVCVCVGGWGRRGAILSSPFGLWLRVYVSRSCVGVDDSGSVGSTCKRYGPPAKGSLHKFGENCLARVIQTAGTPCDLRLLLAALRVF